MALSQYPNVEAIDKAITNSPPKPYNPNTGTDDGFWYIYDPLTQAYFKSNVEHKGKAFEYTDFTPEQLASLRGEKGAYFTPTVNSSGDISWQNNGELPNPATQNIKGQKGDTGAPLKIAGSFETKAELEQTFPSGDGDNSYTVGEAVAVWNGTAWVLTSGYDDTELVARINNIVGGVTTVGNADKLDGKQATDFAPSGFGLGETDNIIDDCNNFKGGAFGYAIETTLNRPPQGNYARIINVGSLSTYKAQIAYAFDDASPSLWFRAQRASEWREWKRLGYADDAAPSGFGLGTSSVIVPQNTEEQRDVHAISANGWYEYSPTHLNIPPLASYGIIFAEVNNNKQFIKLTAFGVGGSKGYIATKYKWSNIWDADWTVQNRTYVQETQPAGAKAGDLWIW